MANWKEVPERTFASFLRAWRQRTQVHTVDIRLGREHYSDPKATWIAKMETIGNTALFHITE